MNHNTKLERIASELIMLNANHFILDRLANSGIQPRHYRKYRIFLLATIQNYFSSSVTTVYKLYFDKRKDVDKMPKLKVDGKSELNAKLAEIEKVLEESREQIKLLRHNYFAHLGKEANSIEKISMQVGQLGVIVDLLNQYLNILYESYGIEPHLSYLPIEYRKESTDIDQIIYDILFGSID